MSNEALFFERGKNIKEFTEILLEVQEYISNTYSSLISDNPKVQKTQIISYIAKYLTDYSLGADGFNFEELVNKLYSEMAEFSFLTKYLYRKDVVEININQWRDIKITYTNGEIIPTKEHFNSPSHAVDVLRRMLYKSGMIFDSSQPIVRGHLSDKTRLTVVGNGVIDEASGVVASIRIVNSKKFNKQDFIRWH
jgi:pilus assembly protein CpaF